jgi:DNA-binding transcriptional regulator YhcF (GntR family)
MLNIYFTEGIPKYKQIADGIKDSIINHRLQPGDRIPNTRELARALHVNSATVIHAYRILRQDGVLRVRRRSGTYVSSTLQTTGICGYRQKNLKNRIDDLIIKLLSQGYSPEELGMTLKLELLDLPAEKYAEISSHNRKDRPTGDVILN